MGGGYFQLGKRFFWVRVAIRYELQYYIYILYNIYYNSCEIVLKEDYTYFLTCYFLLENSSIEVGLFFVQQVYYLRLAEKKAPPPGAFCEKPLYTVYSVRWATYFPVNRVEHQKLNQTTPYGAVWLSFWCSTRPSAGAGN